jgi:hypothetical protein
MKNDTYMRIVLLLPLSLLLFSCRGQIDSTEVKREFEEDNPGTVVVAIWGEAVPSAKGLFGFAANVKISYRLPGSTTTLVQTWYYEKDDKWYRFAKKSFFEISSDEYRSILAKRDVRPAGRASTPGQTQASAQAVGTGSPQEKARSGPQYRECDLVSYIFEVPSTWEVGGPAEQNRMRGMLRVDTRVKISALSTFGAPEDAVVTVYEITVPAGDGANYIDKLYDQSVERFRVGKSSGLIKDVSENRKTQQGAFDALLSDWEAARGGLPHSRQWVLHHAGQIGDKIAVIVAFCDDRGYITTKRAVDRIASTLRVKTAR